MDVIILKLQRNPKDIYLEASRLLRVIADNILKCPENQKLRTLQKSNKTISNKILNVFGGLDCLTFMGFVETETCLTLAQNALLYNVQNARDNIIKFEKLYIENNGTLPQANVSKNAEDNTVEESVKRIVLPPYTKKYQNEFLNNVGYRFHCAQMHDNMYLRNRALKLIPVRQLEINAQENMRSLQKEMKTNNENDFDTTIQDMLILELLNWFKNDFFTWVDSPPCDNCKGTTKFSHMSPESIKYHYSDKVELHKCNTCHAITPFPRYNDLNILMETRRGRCGEWANVFTLFCRAMGWDARHVYDETDHVWTEVYSIGAKRWLHCDPSENICDSPLMYESGWNKKVSYVIAYSGEEIQDVTWRYTSNFKETLKRRLHCTEADLLKVIIDLRTERQHKITDYRRKYLTKRIVEELCELLTEKKPSDKDKRGRTSGSLSWRLLRGEQKHQLANFVPYIWKFFDSDVQENLIKIRYSTAENRYEMISGKGTHTTLSEWYKGLYQAENIFRKEEKDWKMVYLARTEGSTVGTIKWTFEISSRNKVFDIVEIKFDYDLFENGNVEITAIGDMHQVRFLKDEKHIKSQLLSGSARIDIVAVLSGGTGDVAWQHAQLFRQTMDNKDFGLDITFTFKQE